MRVGKEIVKSRTLLISLFASLATIKPLYALPTIFNDENERSEGKLFSAYCGGAYGAENPLGLIKLGAGIRPFNKVAYLNHFYFGITGSVWFIVAGIGSIGAESGLIFNRFSIDGSLTLSELASWEAYRSNGDSTGMYRVVIFP